MGCIGRRTSYCFLTPTLFYCDADLTTTRLSCVQSEHKEQKQRHGCGDVNNIMSIQTIIIHHAAVIVIIMYEYIIEQRARTTAVLYE